MQCEVALEKLRELFASYANPDKAEKMSAYMRNLFPFVGLYSAERKEIFNTLRKEYFPTNSAELGKWVRLLWAQNEREYQYIAMDYLDRYGKLLIGSDISLFDELIESKSWWDTIDIVCGNHLGKFLKKHPELFEATLNRYILHDYFWFNRAAIICQLTYKKNTDTYYLEKAILPHTKSKEFFIQKAIGWALRQYGKTNPDWVVDFVNQNDLMPLSKREALKRIRFN